MDGVKQKSKVKEPPFMCGGVGAEEPANPEVQALCDVVKPEFQVKSGVNAAKFKAVSFKSQTVAGRNFFVKVDLGGGQFCHVRIFEPMPHTGEKASLSGFKLGKKKEDALGYF
ncbi:cystatin-B-like [Bufo gargarizans]|uniref:cystatin-B-like n=1 Tax=Bufo gargarizans TaxID=30331 RepID=UPI001CF3C402|nr:cystatin-B-like [Bufo gargarizans]